MIAPWKVSVFFIHYRIRRINLLQGPISMILKKSHFNSHGFLLNLSGLCEDSRRLLAASITVCPACLLSQSAEPLDALGVHYPHNPACSVTFVSLVSTSKLSSSLPSPLWKGKQTLRLGLSGSPGHLFKNIWNSPVNFLVLFSPLGEIPGLSLAFVP